MLNVHVLDERFKVELSSNSRFDLNLVGAIQIMAELRSNFSFNLDQGWSAVVNFNHLKATSPSLRSVSSWPCLLSALRASADSTPRLVIPPLWAGRCMQNGRTVGHPDFSK